MWGSKEKANKKFILVSYRSKELEKRKRLPVSYLHFKNVLRLLPY